MKIRRAIVIAIGGASISAAAELTVILDVRGTLEPAVHIEFRREFERILKVPDLRIGWRILSAKTAQESFERLAIVRLNGACLAGRTPLPIVEEPDGPPLGLAHVADGKVLPFAEVDCDAVRWMLKGTLQEAGAESRSVLVGRALARVAAHEVYHILAGTTDHCGSGVARESFTLRDLTVRRFRFANHSLERIADEMAVPGGRGRPVVAVAR